MKTEPDNPASALTRDEKDFLRLLKAAIAGKPCDPAPANWPAVIGLARRHQTAEFLFPLIADWPDALKPPAAFMDDWRIAFFRATAQYARITLQAREILAALARGSIPVMPMKGIRHAEEIYDDGACRPMSDIDLLVKEGDFNKARSILAELGYTTPEFDLEDTDGKHIQLKKEGAPLFIELHRRMWRTLDPETSRAVHRCLWDTARPAILHGQPILKTPLETEIPYLARHIVRHNWCVPMRAYLDLALICRKYADTLDSDLLATEARIWKAGFSTPFVLRLAEEIFGIPSPLPSPRVARQEYETMLRNATVAAIRLTMESIAISPTFAETTKLPLWRRALKGMRRLAIKPAELRRIYPREVRRAGLAGGYIARAADLWKRFGKDTISPDSFSAHTREDFENFQTRQTLTRWLDGQDAH